MFLADSSANLVNYSRNRWPLFSTRLVGPRQLPTVRKNCDRSKFLIDFLVAWPFSICPASGSWYSFSVLFYFPDDEHSNLRRASRSFRRTLLSLSLSLSLVFPLFDFTPCAMRCAERESIPNRSGNLHSWKKDLITRLRMFRSTALARDCLLLATP